MTDDDRFAVGNWVVHSRYGVGKIKEIAEMTVFGRKNNKEECLKVVTKDSEYWVPLSICDNERIRPISSRKQFSTALKMLTVRGEHVDMHHNAFVQQIDQAYADASLTTMMSIVRDLFGRNREKTLNRKEERSLKLFVSNLVHEYSLCMGVDVEAAQTAIFDLLAAETRTANYSIIFGVAALDDISAAN